MIWIVSVLLLALSASFSASETALFSLRPTEMRRVGAVARRLLDQPRDVLVTVLLGNLVINVLFFAFTTRLLPGDEGFGDVLGGFLALLAVLLFGEILPKTVALRSRVGVARLGAPAIGTLLRVLAPVRRVVNVVLDAVWRVLGRFARDERTLTAESLAQVLARSRGQGFLARAEAEILAEIVELEGIRVREIMTPRVDVVFLELDGSNREEAVALALERRLSWLPVMDGNPDRIVGRVSLRDLLADRGRPLAQLVMPAKFVPEVASALRLLRDLNDARTAEALVVDEWGGTAGTVTLEEIFEEIVGDLRAEDEGREHEVVPLGEGRYRVSGGLSIRDWNDQFGHRVVPAQFETLGGFLTALLGRIPRSGDRVRYGELALEAAEVRGRRVLSVIIGVDRKAGQGAA